MIKLKSTIAKAVAAAIALSAGTAAFAAQSPLTGPSDLFVAVWNPTTSKSYVEDLGSGWTMADLNSSSTFNSASGFSLSKALDGGSLAADLGAGTYSFALFAGDLSVAGNSFLAYTGNTQFLSQTSGMGATQESNGSVFDNGGQTLAGYVGTNLPGSAMSFLTADDHGAGSKYWAAPSNVNAPGSTLGIGGFQGAASGTGTLSLLKYFGVSENAPDLITPTLVGNSSAAGLFALNDLTGLLSYSLSGGSSPVPLPAAGWLLISGLLGLGAVGRRKGVGAAAAA